MFAEVHKLKKKFADENVSSPPSQENNGPSLKKTWTATFSIKSCRRALELNTKGNENL